MYLGQIWSKCGISSVSQPLTVSDDTVRGVTDREKSVSGKAINITISKELEGRLNALADRMGKSLDDVLSLALDEYADTWEDHLDTVDALKEGDDRVQLAVANDS